MIQSHIQLVCIYVKSPFWIPDWFGMLFVKQLIKKSCDVPHIVLLSTFDQSEAYGNNK